MGNGLFAPGTKLDAPAPAGLYAARLERIESIDTEYGERHKLIYSFELDGVRRQVNELATKTAATGSKIIQRLVAVSGALVVDENLDPSTLPTEGPCGIVLSVDERGFNKIEDVMPASMIASSGQVRNRKGAAPEPAATDDLPF